MVKEIWKDVCGYNDLYEVSNLGNIRMRETKYQKSFRVDKWGYACVTLRERGKDKRRFVHRIVAIAFLKNPKNKAEVNHIDGNKLNNSLDNLEWATSAENEQHAIENGLITPRKAVVGTHKKTNEVLHFESVADAARKTKESECGISSTINGRQRCTKNYYWSLA